MPEQKTTGDKALVCKLPKELTSGGKQIDKLDLLRLLKIFSKELSDMFSEIAVLRVPALGGIKEHTHTEDEEWYVVLSRKGVVISHCACGESHGFRNISGSTVYIIAIKRLVAAESEK